MQEAYWPRHIKYSICCPVPGEVPPAGGYPTLGTPIGPGQGSTTSPSDLAKVPPPTWPGGVPPLWTDRRMDRHVSKHNLPSYYVRGR